jgi:hypothetical protein
MNILSLVSQNLNNFIKYKRNVTRILIQCFIKKRILIQYFSRQLTELDEASVRVAVTANKESASPRHVLPGTIKISHYSNLRAPRTPPPLVATCRPSAIAMAQPAGPPPPGALLRHRLQHLFTPAHAPSPRATLRQPYDVTERASPPSTRPARRWPRVPARGSDGSRSASAG